MAFRHYVVTLTGAAQRVSDVCVPALSGGTGGKEDVPLREMIFTADPANTAVVYVGGGNATVSATSHGFSLDPTQANQVPIGLGGYEAGPLRLSDFYVLGTNGERLMIGVIPF